MDICKTLNESEIKTLCQLITGQEFKRYYQKNPKEYEKINHGFRPQSITNDKAVALAFQNINKPFINSFVNSYVMHWLEEIDDAIEENQLKYEDSEEALAQTLVDSYFVKNIDLYFKLNKEIKSDDYIQKMYSRIDAIQKERTQEAVSVEKKSEVSSSDSDNKTNEDYDKELRIMDQSNKELTEEVERLQKQLVAAETEIKHYQVLQGYVDGSVSDNSIESDYDYISICEVRPVDYNGNQFLLRLADIESDGSIRPFIQAENQPKQFENRSLIYFKNGPRAEGTIGIWEWRAIPNKNDSSKDYVESEYNRFLTPIEVHSLSGCESTDDVITMLKNGIKITLGSDKVMFTTQRGKTHLLGVFCNEDQLIVSSKGVKLNEKTISLPMYSLKAEDIVFLSNEKYYYGNIKLGMPKDIIRLKDALEIVKDILINRGTWNVFKQAGKTRSEWKIARDFYENLDTTSLLQQISDSCNCSISEAQSIFEEFKTNVDKYIDGTTLDDELLAAVIVSNEDLLNRSKELVRSDWEKANAETIGKAKEKKDIANSELKKVQDEHKKVQKELSTLKAKIETEKKVATQIQEELNKQINEANNNAAEFLAKMALFNNPQANSGSSTTIVSSQNKSKYVPSLPLDDNDMDSNNDFRDAITTVSYELSQAGVISELTHSLAAFLYSAYINSVPLLLTGPNAENIADAFSIGVFGSIPGKLDCSDEYNSTVLESISDDSADIVKIINPFSSQWLQRMPQIFKSIPGYSIAIHPFPEDLLIEPHSAYSFMLPINTELFVDSAPVNNFTGGKMSDDFKQYLRKNEPVQPNKDLTALHLTPITRSLLSSVIFDMEEMIEDHSSGYGIIYGLIPLAQAMNQVDIVLGLIRNDQLKLSTTVREIIDSYFGEANE